MIRMNIYLITYDLKSPNRDYTNLYALIKDMGEWQHPLDSVWLIKTWRSASGIYDILRREKGEKDLLMVVKVELSDIQGWLSKSFWNWVNDNNDRNAL